MTMLHQARTLTLPLLLLFGGVFLLALPLHAAVQNDEVEVRGRVLLPDGSPAVGTKLELTVHPTQQQARGGASLALSVTADEAGRFSIRYAPEEGVECMLTAELSGYSTLTWDWAGHPKDGLKLLAERSFAEPLFITGSILDANGELQIEGWSVFAFTDAAVIFRNASQVRNFEPDPATGVFRIGPLDPGTYGLGASSELGGLIQHGSVHVKAGKQAKVLLRFEGRLADRNSITILTASTGVIGPRLNGPFPSELGVEEHPYLFLLDGKGEVLAEASQTKGVSRGYWSFENVPPGEYAVELRHPLFEPVRIEGVSTGSKETIQLVGNAAIELAVTSSEGVALRDYHVGIRYPTSDSLVHLTTPLVGPTTTSAGDQLFDGIVAGRISLSVEAATGEQRDVEMGLLLPGETRRVEVRLAAVVPMEVQVLDPDGLPLEGAVLECTRGEFGDSAITRVYRSSANLAKSGGDEAVEEPLTTGADGRCVLRDLIPGQWSIRVQSQDFGTVSRTVEHLEADTGPVVIRLPRVARLEGRLRCREGFDFSAVEVLVWHEGSSGIDSENTAILASVQIGPEGRFSVPGLPLGKAKLLFQAEGFPESGSVQQGGSILRTVEMTGGVQEWELDLEPLLMAACQVKLRLGEGSSGEMRIVLVSEKRMTRYAKRPVVRKLLGSGAMVEPGGDARVTGLVPATGYTVFAVGADDGWAVAVGQVKTKSYFEEVQFQGQLQLVEREVSVRGAGGEGLANIDIGWACQRVAAAQARATTNAEGKFTLRMPTGSYSIYRADQRRPALVPFEWQAGAGPLAIEMPEDK